MDAGYARLIGIRPCPLQYAPPPRVMHHASRQALDGLPCYECYGASGRLDEQVFVRLGGAGEVEHGKGVYLHVAPRAADPARRSQKMSRTMRGRCSYVSESRRMRMKLASPRVRSAFTLTKTTTLPTVSMPRERHSRSTSTPVASRLDPTSVVSGVTPR
jgi:hypothetical protein